MEGWIPRPLPSTALGAGSHPGGTAMGLHRDGNESACADESTQSMRLPPSQWPVS